MTLLAAPIPVRYAVLEDKYVGRQVLDGSIVRLSETGAESRSAAPVPLLGNLKIWMPESEAGAGPGELYPGGGSVADERVRLHRALHGDGPRADAIQPGSVRMIAEPPPGGDTALSSGRVRQVTMGGCGSVPRLHGSCRVLKCTP